MSTVAAGPAPVVSDPRGLIAFYGFDHGKAEDLSGRGHHGVFSANPPVLAPGIDGDGLAFNDPNITL